MHARSLARVAHIGGARQAAESGAYAAGTTGDSLSKDSFHYCMRSHTKERLELNPNHISNNCNLLEAWIGGSCH